MPKVAVEVEGRNEGVDLSVLELYGPAVFELQAQVAGTSCRALGMGAKFLAV
jgi:hypothetical protein